MARLTQRDVSDLLDCIGELYAHHDLDSFGQRALALSRKLVPSAYGTYNGVNPRTKGGWYATDPAGLDLGLSREDMRLIAGVNPLITHYQCTRDGAARKISDYMTRGRYRETALYREVFRRIGVESQMAFYLPKRPPTSVAVALIRDRDDFTERDRLVLNLLRPHLFRSYRNAELIGQLRKEAALADQVLETSQRGVIILNRRGRVQFCSLRARQWLAAYRLPLRRAGGALPDELRRWVRQCRSSAARSASLPAAPQPLTMRREGHRLLIRLLPDSTPGQQMLLLQERVEPSPVPLQRFGLTPRQAEVLFWVAEGKTSPEIGLILACRTATVNKHMERILGKLGVETRTAAAACAWQAMSSAGVDGGH
jgi:DNA-binding CsgD family transcriptional regulator